jgi:fermentation-respiration switch protein FrsA (DUF1100 family)
VWLLSGTADRTVPHAHALSLYQAALPPKHLHTFAGGSHSRLQAEFPLDYQRAWLEVHAFTTGPALIAH